MLPRPGQAPLSPADVEALATEVDERRVAGGTFVFRHGDESSKIHILRKGSIELSREIAGRAVALQLLRPGDVFGDVPAFLGDPEPFDARAIDDSIVLSVDAATLFSLLGSRPNMARRWFISLAERMAGLQDRLVDLLAGPLEAQLASLLLREADDAWEVHVTQAHLARLLGAQRSSVQRVLKSLESADLIELRYRRVRIVDVAALGALLDDC